MADTWHHGLVARWWAEFNLNGPEINYFKKVIQKSGSPALDVGCGTGRILIPCLEAGIEVHGSDISPEMIHLCQTRLDAQDLVTNLEVVPTHELDLDQKYQTIISCGVFGVGTNREEDLEGLKRLQKHLVLGGKLVFDFYLPGENSKEWITWAKDYRPTLPSPWSKPKSNKLPDGSDLVLQTRNIELNTMEQYYVKEIRIEQYKKEILIERYEDKLRLNVYFKNEILLMLKTAGFLQVKVLAGLSDVEPVSYQDYHLMVIASNQK